MNEPSRLFARWFWWLALAALAACAGPSGNGSGSAALPHFKVDPAWPQALPNGWILGQVSGVAVGPDDHVWIVQRPKS